MDYLDPSEGAVVSFSYQVCCKPTVNSAVLRFPTQSRALGLLDSELLVAGSSDGDVTKRPGERRNS